jgi:glycosyl transferase, family 25
VKTYVVNLARSVDRRAHMLRELCRTTLDHEFVDAVDGRELDLTDATLYDTSIVGTSNYRPGAAGCALSHLAIYRKVIGGNEHTVLILEDDVTLPADLAELAQSIAPQMSGAEVALLNFHSRESLAVTRSGLCSLPASRLLVQVVDVHQPSSTGAYVITREACARLLRIALPLRVHPDAWGFFHDQGALDRVRCVVPMPVHNSATLRTTIDYYQPGSMQARLRQAVASGRVPIARQILTLRRQRTFRRWGWTGEAVFAEDRQAAK